MSITMKNIKTIKSDLAKRRPARLTIDENRPLTTKEAIVALAPELGKMKSRRFTTAAIVEILREHKINIKGGTLNRYLNELKVAEKPNQAVEEDNNPPVDSRGKYLF